jgi:DNA-binding MarR family transcriptional regulator
MDDRHEGDQLLPMANNLSYRLSLLHALLGRKTANIYLSRGLNSHQWKVMSVLFSWPPMAAARITELVTLDKASISRAVTSLLKLKLADRRPDPETGAINVILTAAGRATYRDMMAEMFAIQQRVLASLSSVEKQALFRTFDKVETTLRAIEATPAGATDAPRRRAGTRKSA